MFSYEINDILFSQVSTKHVFQGAFPCDKIPKNIKTFPQAYIINTDESYQEGTHWVAIYQETKSSKKEYFDSFGFPPLKQVFYEFISDDYLLYSNLTLQNIFSNVCGEYAIYYILKRTKQERFQDILSEFTAKKAKNCLTLQFVINVRKSCLNVLKNTSNCTPSKNSLR